MPSEPSANASYRTAHILAGLVTVLLFVRLFPHFNKWYGVPAGFAVASFKEWVYDPIIERDGLGWWNKPPLQDVGGSLQDWAFWLIGVAIGAAVLWMR
jgi:hypothetical protein